MILLETRDLARSFGPFWGLDGVDLTLEQGEILSVIGPNGAGKTTLINCISGFLKPSRGSVTLMGTDVTGLKPHQIVRRGLVRSFQTTAVYPRLSTFENVRLAVQAAHRETGAWHPAEQYTQVNDEAEAALERVGLTAKRDEPASVLSHGDRRSLDLAMAVASGAKVLLLDEPMAGMSPHEKQTTFRLMQDLQQDHAILLVEHDIDVVMSISSRILVLHHGKPLAAGAPEEIAEHPEVRTAYLGVHV